MYIFHNMYSSCMYVHHILIYSQRIQRTHHTKYRIGIFPMTLDDESTMHEVFMYALFRASHITYSTESFVCLAESIHVLSPRFTSVAHHSVNAGAGVDSAPTGVQHVLKSNGCISEETA